MYDERDGTLITQKLHDLVAAKREAKENEFSANFFARAQNLGVSSQQAVRKLTREQETAKKRQIQLESRVRFQELSDTILEYQLSEHALFLAKFTRQFKQVDR